MNNINFTFHKQLNEKKQTNQFQDDDEKISQSVAAYDNFTEQKFDRNVLPTLDTEQHELNDAQLQESESVTMSWNSTKNAWSYTLQKDIQTEMNYIVW